MGGPDRRGQPKAMGLVPNKGSRPPAGVHSGAELPAPFHEIESLEIVHLQDQVGNADGAEVDGRLPHSQDDPARHDGHRSLRHDVGPPVR